MVNECVFDAGDPGRLLTTIQCVLNVGWLLVCARKMPVIPAVSVRLGQNKLRKSLGDARFRATQRGRQHWISACPNIEAWIANRPASTAASIKPVSEISSLVDSGDDFSNNKLIISTRVLLVSDFEVLRSIRVTTNMAGMALPPSKFKCGNATLRSGFAADPWHNTII